MILSTIERVVKVLAKLLSFEASRHAKQCNHLENKAYNHGVAEDKAVNNMRAAGAAYRCSLQTKADIHERHADKANALASKLGGLL